MNNRCWLMIFLLCLPYYHHLYAQAWSKEDSIRLAKILASEDSIRLNPETMQAIREGTFINVNPVGSMNEAKSKIPFSKDFSEYIKLDKRFIYELRKPLDSILPQAAMREEHYVDNSMRVNSLITDPIRKGDVSGVKPTGYDFNHWISYALSPSYRQETKNRKRDTWKIYNDIPALRTHEKQKAYREEHPEMVIDE